MFPRIAKSSGYLLKRCQRGPDLPAEPLSCHGNPLPTLLEDVGSREIECVSELNQHMVMDQNYRLVIASLFAVLLLLTYRGLGVDRLKRRILDDKTGQPVAEIVANGETAAFKNLPNRDRPAPDGLYTLEVEGIFELDRSSWIAARVADDPGQQESHLASRSDGVRSYKSDLFSAGWD